MKRYLEKKIISDLHTKMVTLTGPRQFGKATLGRQLMENFDCCQNLKWDILADRVFLQRQSWNQNVQILVLDEIHKMRAWKPRQSLLVMECLDGNVSSRRGFSGRAIFGLQAKSDFGSRMV